MEIKFHIQRLPALYQFKKETIQICLDFIKNVVKNSSQSKMRTLVPKLKEIETDLYDIFCRWNFNSIQNKTFDIDLFLPTDSFIQMVDISYYINRFHIQLEDSLVPFPTEEFKQIIERAHHNHYIMEDVRATKCSDVQKRRLSSIYKGHQLDTDIQRLLSRYYYLGGLNNSLSTPPTVLSLFHSHEMFGTPMNTCSPHFCSPFEDEKVFGSSGSFFDFTDYQEDVVYFANPPFDDTFCTKMAKKLLEDLDKKTFSLVVIIPVWDKDQQIKHNLKNFGLPFDSYNQLVTSRHFIKEMFLPKNQYPFYNYFHQKYVYISNTHLINLGKPVDLDLIRTTWQKHSERK